MPPLADRQGGARGQRGEPGHQLRGGHRPRAHVPRLPGARAVIEVQDLQKSFGQVAALRGVSFDARDGEITGLLGPNGAGKTTTLRILTTVLSADRGRTLVDGLDAAKDPLAVRSRLGALPHAHGLSPRLTAREHIRYFGELHGLRGAERARRTDEMLELLE